MKRLLLIFLMLWASVGYSGEVDKIKVAQTYQEVQTLKQLHELEPMVVSNPEEAIKQLDDILRKSINNNLNESVSYAYLLIGRGYKELKQPKLALHFMQLAEESYKVLKNKGKLYWGNGLGYIEDIKYRNKEVSEGKIDKSVSGKLKVGKKINSLLPAVYYLDLGEIYAQMGEYYNSTSNYKLYQSSVADSLKAHEIQYNIADNFYAAEEFKQAAELYETILQKELRANNEEKVQMCRLRLAASFISDGQIDRGLEMYNLTKNYQPIFPDSFSIDSISIGGSRVANNSVNYNTSLVSEALRNQNLYQEELNILNGTILTTGSGLSWLRLAQTYYQTNDFVKTEESLDKYFLNFSNDIIDKKEVEVIRNMAVKLKEEKRTEKALYYAFKFQELSDTIDARLDRITARSEEIGSLGAQSIMRLRILQKDKEMSNNTINYLMRESELKEDLVGVQKIMIYILSMVIVLGIITLIYIVRVSKQRRIANQQLALRSLRSQMNPHFIFNALNSVNSFISISDERAANRFLAEFSTLMRTVMENSEHDFIPLTKELEIVKIYLELEHFRFKDKFSFQLNIDKSLDEEAYVLPTMLIQPYIENAIWHGLRYKEEKGELIVSFAEKDGKLKVCIQDNGIGRAKSQEIKTKNQKKSKSLALRNIGERVELFNNLHRIKVEVSVTDLLDDGTGTLVELIIPQPKHG